MPGELERFRTSRECFGRHKVCEGGRLRGKQSSGSAPTLPRFHRLPRAPSPAPAAQPLIPRGHRLFPCLCPREKRHSGFLGAFSERAEAQRCPCPWQLAQTAVRARPRCPSRPALPPLARRVCWDQSPPPAWPPAPTPSDPRGLVLTNSLF